MFYVRLRGMCSRKWVPETINSHEMYLCQLKLMKIYFYREIYAFILFKTIQYERQLLIWTPTPLLKKKFFHSYLEIKKKQKLGTGNI